MEKRPGTASETCCKISGDASLEEARMVFNQLKNMTSAARAEALALAKSQFIGSAPTENAASS